MMFMRHYTQIIDVKVSKTSIGIVSCESEEANLSEVAKREFSSHINYKEAFCLNKSQNLIINGASSQSGFSMIYFEFYPCTTECVSNAEDFYKRTYVTFYYIDNSIYNQDKENPIRTQKRDSIFLLTSTTYTSTVFGIDRLSFIDDDGFY